MTMIFLHLLSDYNGISTCPEFGINLTSKKCSTVIPTVDEMCVTFQEFRNMICIHGGRHDHDQGRSTHSSTSLRV